MAVRSAHSTPWQQVARLSVFTNGVVRLRFHPSRAVRIRARAREKGSFCALPVGYFALTDLLRVVGSVGCSGTSCADYCYSSPREFGCRRRVCHRRGRDTRRRMK